MLFITKYEPDLHIVEEYDIDKSAALFDVLFAYAYDKATLFKDIHNFFIPSTTLNYFSDLDVKARVDISGDRDEIKEKLNQYCDGYYLIRSLAANNNRVSIMFIRIEDSYYYPHLIKYIRKREIDKILKEL